MFVPVCTLSPISSSDIVTDFPFSTLTVATDGKHFAATYEMKNGRKSVEIVEKI